MTSLSAALCGSITLERVVGGLAFGFWFVSSAVRSMPAVVEVGVGIVTAAVATGVGVGVGNSISVDSDGVPRAINSCYGSKAGSSSSSSGIDCSGCVLGVAGAVVIAKGIVVVVAGINIEFKGLLHEVWVVVFEGSIFPQECAVVGNGFLCLLPFLLEDVAICMSKCAPNVVNGTVVKSGVSWMPDGVSLIHLIHQE